MVVLSSCASVLVLPSFSVHFSCSSVHDRPAILTS